MRLLTLLLILAISAQPLQAGFCDMDSSQEAAHHMEQSEGADHDCCDSDEPESQQTCDGQLHCGYCSVSVSALPKIPKINADWVNLYTPSLSSGLILPSHSSPPFRPPIS